MTASKSKCRCRREATEAPRIKQAFNEAQQKLDATNVRQDEVLNAVEHLTGPQRDQRLAELASDEQDPGGRSSRISRRRSTRSRQLRANPQKLPLPMLAAQVAAADGCV